MNIKDLLENGKKVAKRSKKKRATQKFAVGAGIGAIVGTVAGILFAPKAGKETRADIIKGAKKAADITIEKVAEVKEKVSDVLIKKEAKCCCNEEKPAE